MHEDTVVSFSHPDRVSIEDPLTAVLRSGARQLLAEAVEELLPVTGGEKWDRRGGVKRDHSVFEACPGSPREGPARGAACPSMGDAAARVGGACGPTRTSGGVVVGSAAV